MTVPIIIGLLAAALAVFFTVWLWYSATNGAIQRWLYPVPPPVVSDAPTALVEKLRDKLAAAGKPDIVIHVDTTRFQTALQQLIHATTNAGQAFAQLSKLERYFVKAVIKFDGLYFEPRDIWLGIYWKYTEDDEANTDTVSVHICFLPLLPVVIKRIRQYDYRILP